MKPPTLLLAAAILVSIQVASSHAQQEQLRSTQSRSSSSSSSSSSETSSSKKRSVTITSDGKNTVKRTVTTTDGITKIVVETTDENGNTTVTEGDPDEGSLPAEENGGAWMGVKVEEVSKTLRDQLGLPADEGLEVVLVAPGGPAAEAGLSAVDLILTFAGTPVSTATQLADQLRRYDPGDSIKLVAMRKGKRGTLDVTLVERPPRRDEDAPAGLADEIGDPKAVEVSISTEGAAAGAAFGVILDNPDLPDSFKDTVRKMQQRMKEFEKRHQQD